MGGRPEAGIGNSCDVYNMADCWSTRPVLEMDQLLREGQLVTWPEDAHDIVAQSAQVHPSQALAAWQDNALSFGFIVFPHAFERWPQGNWHMHSFQLELERQPMRDAIY